MPPKTRNADPHEKFPVNRKHGRRSWIYLREGGHATDWRSIRRQANNTRIGVKLGSATRWRRRLSASVASSPRSIFTVVNGGDRNAVVAISSNPITETS